MKFKSKTISTALLCVACSLTGYAESKVILESSKEGEAAKEAGLDVNTKIRFSSTSVQIDNGGNISTIPFSDVEKIRFKTSEISVGSIGMDVAKYALRHNPVESALEVVGYNGVPARLSVSSLNGRQEAVVESWQGESVDVSMLTPGVYLLTIDNETIKFIKK